MAKKIADGLIALGYELAADTESNQIFPRLPMKVIEALGHDFGFYIWDKVDAENAVDPPSDILGNGRAFR